MSSDAQPAHTSAAEGLRLEAVRRYDILDTPPDGAFDRVASLAARHFNVPIATVSIVDEDRIWFKAAHGLEVTEIGRDPGLCASAILQDDPYIVTDAIDDPRCLDNPLVRGELGVRFYAAAPIRTPDGHNLGTVNVISGEPREVTPEEAAFLSDLADVVAHELEVRLAARRTVEAERDQRRRAEHLLDVLQRRLLPQRAPAIPHLDVATYYRPATSQLEIGGDFIDVFELDDGGSMLAIGDVCGKGPDAAAATGDIRSALRAIARTHSRPEVVLTRLNDLLNRDGLGAGDVDPVSGHFCTASVVRVEPTGAELSCVVATAGHPLALLRRADGTVEPFGAPGQLLGPFPDIDLHEVGTTLQAGELLLLYTDGAVERRSEPTEDEGAALVHALRSAPTDSAEAALAHVRAAVEDPHERFHDDVALVLARATT